MKGPDICPLSNSLFIAVVTSFVCSVADLRLCVQCFSEELAYPMSNPFVSPFMM